MATRSPGTAGTPPSSAQVRSVRYIDVRFIPVGKDGRNVGIVAFNVRRYLANKLSHEVLVEVQNFGAAPATRRLERFYAGDEAIDVKTPGPSPARRAAAPDLPRTWAAATIASSTRTIDAPRRDRQPEKADAFPLDDTAWALLPERKKQHVLLVTADNLYLEAALLLDPNIAVDKLKP